MLVVGIILGCLAKLKRGFITELKADCLNIKNRKSAYRNKKFS